MPISYSASDIVEWFVRHPDRDVGEPLTNLKLQKLLYYAQGWSLVVLGRPLIEGDFEAWQHGPVHPDAYAQLAPHKDRPLPTRLAREATIVDPLAERLLERMQASYGRKSAKELYRSTHREPPWKAARMGFPEDRPSNNPITRSAMSRYFGSLARPALGSLGDGTLLKTGSPIPGLEQGLSVLRARYPDTAELVFESFADLLRLIVRQIVATTNPTRLRSVSAGRTLANGEVELENLRFFDIPVNVEYVGSDKEAEVVQEVFVTTLSAPLFLDTGMMPVIRVIPITDTVDAAGSNVSLYVTSQQQVSA